VVVGFLVVQVGALVVDGGVHPALLQQRNRLRPALNRLHLGTGRLGQFVPVAGERLGGGLALQVGQRGNIVVVTLHDDDAGAHRVGVGEVVLGLALFVDGDLVGDDVET